MAKWSGIYLEDCHTLLKKIEKKLEKVVRQESNHQWITTSTGDEVENGRYTLAKELQNKIKKWRKEMYNEK
jgi:hypothetical protein